MLSNNEKYPYKYHCLAKINWPRELDKLYKLHMTYLQTIPKKTNNRVPLYIYWRTATEHPDITIDIINKSKIGHWDYVSLSYHRNITWDIFVEYLNTNNYSSCISYNPNITIEIINANADFAWDWMVLSYNPSITWDVIQANPNKPWNWNHMAKNPNITWDIIKCHPKLQLADPIYISRNPTITWDIVRDNPEYSWDWIWISQHPNITWDIIKDNPGYPWDWGGILQNPNITWDIISGNILINIIGKEHYLRTNKFTAQAKLSLAKYQLKAHQEINYLARYILPNTGLIVLAMEYGY